MNYDYLKRPLVLVIFGITGDLAQRKLLPALYQLLKAGDLPDELHIIGVSRREVTKDDVYAKLRSFVGEFSFDEKIEQKLKKSTDTVQMDLLNPDAYHELLEHLQAIEKTYDKVNRMYYLSIPSQAFTPVIQLMGRTGHQKELACGEDPRLLIEKPFGYDLASAKTLIHELSVYFDEDQIYRIDHYVAKETVQNILTFRFQNPLFESVWNNRHIDHISVVAREQIDIEGRAAFYEQTGALRDFVQNHLLQLLAITTMQRPTKLESGDIHTAKLDLLRAVEAVLPSKVAMQAVRGQYEGYRAEAENPSSITETYVRLALHIDNDQWRGVPIVLETGKALDAKCTEISISFRQRDDEPAERNRLVFRIQPQEGITLHLQAKQPGIKTTVGSADMDFDYAKSFNARPAEAYERVIVDAIRGDQTLFASAAEVLRSWEIVENVLQRWQRDDEGLLFYPKGSMGPVESHDVT